MKDFTQIHETARPLLFRFWVLEANGAAAKRLLWEFTRETNGSWSESVDEEAQKSVENTRSQPVDPNSLQAASCNAALFLLIRCPCTRTAARVRFWVKRGSKYETCDTLTLGDRGIWTIRDTQQCVYSYIARFYRNETHLIIFYWNKNNRCASFRIFRTFLKVVIGYKAIRTDSLGMCETQGIIDGSKWLVDI